MHVAQTEQETGSAAGFSRADGGASLPRFSRQGVLSEVVEAEADAEGAVKAEVGAESEE